MLIIRKEQKEALAKAARNIFEERMLVHLKKFFPDECQELGKDGTREAIRHAMDHAGSYGIVAERDIYIYTDVQFAFGRNFDKDLTWAAEILNDESLQNAYSAKVDRLHEAALENVRDTQYNQPEPEGLGNGR